jgi:hypothetical protein
MADQKKQAAADAGAGEVQDAYEQAQERGYIGVLPQQPPREAYTLKTGPESPSSHTAEIDRLEQRIKDLKASTGKEA